MPCAPNMRGCRRDCLHRVMVHNYHHQRDARDALRESGHCMQLEDEEFDDLYPRVTFKQWLQGYWEKEPECQ